MYLEKTQEKPGLFRVSLVCVALIIIVMSGCASNQTVHTKNMPLKEGISKYVVTSVNVNLQAFSLLGNKGSGFASQSDLEQQFKSAIQKQLSERGILAKSELSADAELEISIAYTRQFNPSGNSITTPKISHVVNISKGGTLLVTLNESDWFPSYGVVESMEVNAKKMAFQWGAEDELRDVNQAGYRIVSGIAKVGD